MEIDEDDGKDNKGAYSTAKEFEFYPRAVRIKRVKWGSDLIRHLFVEMV